jgi:hypothetical protein
MPCESKSAEKKSKMTIIQIAIGKVGLFRTPKNMEIAEWLYDSEIELNEDNFDAALAVDAAKLSFSLQNLNAQLAKEGKPPILHAVTVVATPIMRQAEKLYDGLENELSASGKDALISLFKTGVATKEQLKALANNLHELTQCRPYSSHDPASFPLSARVANSLMRQVFDLMSILPGVIARAPTASAALFAQTVAIAVKRDSTIQNTPPSFS